MNNGRLSRLITGFNHFGYRLSSNDDSGHFYEFRKPGTVLRFVVRGAEGGVVLFWTELEDYDLISPRIGNIVRNMPSNVKCESISDSDKFWKIVEDVATGHDIV